MIQRRSLSLFFIFLFSLFSFCFLSIHVPAAQAETICSQSDSHQRRHRCQPRQPRRSHRKTPGNDIIPIPQEDIIYGTLGDDIIVVPPGTPCNGVISYKGQDIITVEEGAEVLSDIQHEGESTADAAALAIDSGSGNDQVINYGIIGANAGAIALGVDDRASQAKAKATGIRTACGADLVDNFFEINATATSTSSYTFPLLPNISNGATAEAAAVGIDAGAGDDQIVNRASINTTSEANASSFATLPLPGSEIFFMPPNASAHSTGIAGGFGNDQITNTATVDVTATSNSTSFATSLLEVKGGAISEAGAEGILALSGDDQIVNENSVNTRAEAHATSESVMVSPLGFGTYAVPTTATANATGIAAGAGSDSMTNNGTVEVNAVSDAYTASGAVALLQYEVTAEGDARTEARASAVGIAAGDGDDSAINTGSIIPTAYASASTLDVSIELVGAVKANASTSSTASAVGIGGGAGNDGISNSGSINMNTVTAVSESNAVDVKFLNIPMWVGELFGADLGDAKTAAETEAIGIAGGSGDDTIDNTGIIDIFALADADSNTVTAALTITASPSGSGPSAGVSGTASVAAGGSTAPLAPPVVKDSEKGGNLVDTGTIASTFVTGIDGGEGMDTVSNTAKIIVKGESDADSVSVSPTIKIAKGSVLNIIPGMAAAEAGTTAETVATGMDGGGGSDALTNEDELVVEANANSTSASVAVLLQETTTLGLAWGGTISDAKTKAIAAATGIAGAEDDDVVENSGKIIVTAKPDADSASISATLMGAKEGMAAGFSYADAETTAEAAAVGISGGSGDDTIANTSTGQIEVTADPTSTSASVAVTVEAVTGLGGVRGAAMADGTTKAVANAIGVEGGAGDDAITNDGRIVVNSNPDADSASISATLTGAKEGMAAGFAYADAETTAEAAAVGIRGGSGDDTIANTSTGQIEVTADPTSTSASVGVTVSGVIKGIDPVPPVSAAGAAMADGTTKAVANAIGVEGGAGDDAITNDGRIVVNSNPDADSASISATLTGAKEGMVVGFAYADAETTAEATAVGISGGSGDDTIANTSTGQIEVTANPTSSSASVGVTVSGAINGTGIVGGAAMADGTTQAVADAIAVEGGAGDDAITNAGRIVVNSSPDADSASIVVNIGASLGEIGGIVGGISYADNETTARAAAVGIDAGTGNDHIKNSGDIEITTRPTGTSASVAVTVEAVTGLGGAMGAALTDGTTKSISNATGINGGDGKDRIDNSGRITLDSTSVAGSTSVSVGIVGGEEGAAAGVSYADATTTAASTAVGIEDRNGRAAVTHSGTIISSATAETDSESVSVSAVGEKMGLAAGVSLADLTTLSEAASYGIDTSETNAQEEKRCVRTGGDTIDNLGMVDADAIATTTAASVAVELSAALTGVTAGVSAARTDVTATAFSTGLRTGGGDDTILNDGVENAEGFSLDSYAHATSSSDTVAVTVSGAWEGVALGASLAKADTRAEATAVGIDAGEGSDTVTSNSGIRANAVSDVTSDSVSVNAAFSYKGVSAGVALSDTRTEAQADATGISGGGGNDELTNRSSMDAKATAKAKTGTLTIDIAMIGAAIAQASSTASSEATGLDSGRGVDVLINEGDISVAAVSTADDTAATANFIGYASGNIASTATATATGIRGDAADVCAAGDTIVNLAGGSVHVDSHATLNARNYVVQGGGAAFADAAGTVQARATGFSSAAGADSVINQGSVDVTARSEADVSSTVMELTGVSAGKAGTDLTTRATGVDAGNGKNTITNASTGKINVTSKANATATSLTLNMGVALQRAAITAETSSTGILSGDDKDVIENEGDIVVAAATSMGAANGQISLVGLSTADSVTKASVEGINAGGGADVIVNTGSITAGNIPDGGDPLAYVEVADVSISFFNIGLGFLGSKALATGIIGGDGDDIIDNAGTIRIGDDDWMTESKAFGFEGNFLEFFSLTGAGAAAETVSTGISGGQGYDNITNNSSGVLDVKATAYAQSDGAADVTTFGNPKVFANAKTKATATGISGGQGNDVVINLGAITTGARARADTSTYAFVGWGNPKADSLSHAVASAWGIDAGEGWNFIRNEGEISADSVAVTHSFAKADSDVDDTESIAASWSEAFAYGVAGGSDGNTVFNTDMGTITATSLARTYDPQAGMETKAVSDEKATAKTSEPATAYAAGILLGDGDDTVVNDGNITAKSSCDAGAYATSNSWPYSARSDAKAVGAATAVGISAGDGDNWVLNNGQILVQAWGNVEPGADSFSRDRTSTTIAIADASALATGIAGSGDILNAAAGSIEVTARATGSAKTGQNDPASEDTTASADLTARATGISTVSDTIRIESDRIWNDGSISVTALTGEDENGAPEYMAKAVVDTATTKNKAMAKGSSMVDAAGIRIGNNNAEIANTGNINVLGRARAYLYARSDEDADSVSGAGEETAVTAIASGIQTGDGNNLILNQGSINAVAIVETVSTTKAASVTFTAAAKTVVGGGARATGITAGNGNNIIINEGDIFSRAENAAPEDSNGRRWNAIATYFSEHLDWAVSDAGGEEASLTAEATGIRVGDGSNTIENLGTLTVESYLNAEAYARANTASADNYGIAKAGGVATATGILGGDGYNTINNFGSMNVEAEAYGYALGRAEEYATALSHPTAEATGVLTGDGGSVISNSGELTVSATAIAKAMTQEADESRTSSETATAWATGIQTGDGGGNQIYNSSLLSVSSTATSDVDVFFSTGTADSTAIGIKNGNGKSEITNTGDVFVYSTAVATGGAWDTTRTANSTAIGINSGNGKSEITNTGDVFVHSTAIATGGMWSTSTATGTAIGINSGNGGNHVINNKTIDVTATATGDDGGTSAEAYGIKTGSGDDTIINNGTITVTEIVNGVTSMGTAIDAGGGDDVVKLNDASVVNGDIDLGAGDNALSLEGTPVINGNISDALSNLTLVFNNSGSYGSALPGVTAIKEGPGTFTLSMLNQMEHIEVNRGTLKLNNDYQFLADGMFQAKVYGGGTHGQFYVNGETGLDGEMKVVRGGGAYVDGTTYDVLKASNGIQEGTTFTNVELPDDTPLLKFSAKQLADAMQVEADVASFTTVATNPLQGTIAQYLDRITPTATGDLSEVIGNIQFLQYGSEFRTAFSSLSPDSYDNATRTTFDVTRQYTKTLQQRMHGLRASLVSPGTEPRARSDDVPLLLAYNGSEADIGQLLTAKERARDEGKYGLWLQPFGQWGDQDEEDGYTGFDYRMAGITFGFDYALRDRLIAGVSVDYADTDIDLDRNAGDGAIENLGGSIYGSYFTDRAHLEAVLSYGKQRYDNERNIMIGSVLRTAHSDHDGDAFSAFAEGGYHLDFEGWTAAPFASLQYIYLDEESFAESGAGAVSLFVDDRTTDSLVSELGLRLGRVFQTATGSLVPEASLAWKYDFEIDDRDITASFVGSPGAAFTITGQDVDDHGAVFGAGLTFIHKSGFSTSLKYNAELRGDYSAHGIIGQIRYVF